MGWRKTSEYEKPRAKSEQFCDICGAVIKGPHYTVDRNPSHGYPESPEYGLVICSTKCFQAFAAKETDPAKRGEYDEAAQTHSVEWVV